MDETVVEGDRLDGAYHVTIADTLHEILDFNILQVKGTIGQVSILVVECLIASSVGRTVNDQLTQRETSTAINLEATLQHGLVGGIDTLDGQCIGNHHRAISFICRIQVVFTTIQGNHSTRSSLVDDSLDVVTRMQHRSTVQVGNGGHHAVTTLLLTEVHADGVLCLRGQTAEHSLTGSNLVSRESLCSSLLAISIESLQGGEVFTYCLHIPCDCNAAVSNVLFLERLHQLLGTGTEEDGTPLGVA